tara:strand:- start:4235 stop:4789 length:555 start_codon:yes stop_codon:yes gene_type:complete
MSWKKILNSDHIGIDFPSFSHSHTFGLTPQEFEGNPDSLIYNGAEYALGNLFSGTANFTLDEATETRGLVIAQGPAGWTYANNLEADAKKTLGIYVGNDPDIDHIKILTEGYIALPSSHVDVADETTMAPGKQIYLSTDGTIQHSPSVAVNRVIRSLGHCISYIQGVGGIFHFKPESVWVTLKT